MKKVFIASLILLFLFMMMDGLIHQSAKTDNSKVDLAGQESKEVQEVQLAF